MVDADGYKRTVDYTSDAHTGFVATVRRDPLEHKVVKVAAPVVKTVVAHQPWAAPTVVKTVEAHQPWAAPAVVKSVETHQPWAAPQQWAAPSAHTPGAL